MPDELVRIATFSTPAEAAAARLALEAEGIPSFLKDDNVVGMLGLYANAVGYIKLLVAATDAQKARGVLDAPHHTWASYAEGETWKCRQCGETVDNRLDKCHVCGLSRYHEPSADRESEAGLIQTLLADSDEARRQAQNPYAPPRVPTNVAEDDDADDSELGDAASHRARCPSCHRARMAVCPYCKTSGSRFRAADVVDAAESEEDETDLLICPTCDEPFEASYLRICEWCGHDFGQGLDAPAVINAPAFEPVNWRVVLVGIAGVAIVAALVFYFAVILS